MKVGILDIGTNSIHIIIAEIGRDNSFEIVGRAKDMTRLGDETLKTGFLPKEKLERALGVIRQFAQLARNRGVPRIIGVATAAVREASNGGEFLGRVQRECGIKVRTVTGDEEGRLIYLAVRHFVHLGGKLALILDIGGGSAELIAGSDRELKFVRSHKLGGARLKDLFITKYPVPKSDHERVHRHIRESIAPTLEELRALPLEQVIGTSGTIINLGSVIKEHRDDEPLTNPQGFSFSTKELEDLHKDLGRADEKELEEIKGLDPERKDILLPGACLVLEVLAAIGKDRVTLCDRAIREGLILDFMAKNAKKLQMEAEVPNTRLRSVLQLANRCEYDEAHGRQSAKLALQIFDQLPLGRDLHLAARELLEYGAMLHDIGYHVSFDAHHKHGWYLIKNTELFGFSPEEIDILACIARYHRKRRPRKNDWVMRNLTKRDRRTVEALAGIVSVADALDRSHFGVVEAIKVVVRPKSILLRVVAKHDPATEIYSAQVRKDLLERVLGRSVEIEASLRGEAARPRTAEPIPVESNGGRPQRGTDPGRRLPGV